MPPRLLRMGLTEKPDSPCPPQPTNQQVVQPDRIPYAVVLFVVRNIRVRQSEVYVRSGTIIVNTIETKCNSLNRHEKVFQGGN